MELKGIEYLRDKLSIYEPGVLNRYSYYAMKNYDLDFGITIPINIRNRYRAVLGWSAKAVDALADRLVFREFQNDSFGLNEIYKLNNSDIMVDNAISSALIASCAFAYISTEDKRPVIEVIQASRATGILDVATNLLTEGYAILSVEDGKVKKEAYFEPYQTTIYVDGQVFEVFFGF